VRDERDARYGARSGRPHKKCGRGCSFYSVDAASIDAPLALGSGALFDYLSSSHDLYFEPE